MIDINSDKFKQEVANKLRDINTKMQKINTHQWDITFNLLNAYKQGIAQVFSSVDARGGYPVFDFRIPGAQGGGTSSRWPRLSPFTVAYKAHAKTLHTADQIAEVMDNYASSMKIWTYTGAAARNLRIDIQSGTASITDAAIRDYVNLVEKGGEGSWKHKDGSATRIPARPLFSAANEFFADLVHRQLQNTRSVLYTAIVNELKSSILSL